MRHTLGHRSWGCWRKRMSKNEDMTGVESYMDHVADAASFEAYKRKEEDPRVSAETLAASNSMIDFKTFAHDYPDKLMPLLEHLRPEFQELFAEYWLLGKSQSFIGDVHGFIQTRVWQNLRIIEQAIGSLILLGTNPNEDILAPILEKVGLEKLARGRLSSMIVGYAQTHSYARVAAYFGIPVPAVRKIFRPTITSLLASKDVKAVAVGAYLRSLTHQASLTGAGLSKRCKARNRRVMVRRFDAPPSEISPLISFGHVESLGEMSWELLEISSDHRMEQIGPLLRPQGKRAFGKKAAQIFAPLNTEGELEFGYIFARCGQQSLVRKLLHTRGIAEISVLTDDEGNFKKAVTVPHADVLAMIKKHKPAEPEYIRLGDFVEVLTGAAAHYCGTVTNFRGGDVRTVEVNFPTGRKFFVAADVSSLRKLPKVPASQRTFWGVLGS